jgi:hypothetical protein
MLRIIRSLPFVIMAGVAAPIAVNAAPLSTLPKVQVGATQSHKPSVKFVLVNKSQSSHTVMIEGQAYTLTPHQSIPITASQGAQAIATGEEYGESGKLLFTVDKMLKGTTVGLN